tara:strand:+ start:94 stop:276 length:183 start_codon:yes stop_codon:yes gene_type:complete
MIDYNTDVYTQQICDQTGMTPAEVRKSSRPATITLDVARRSGYDSIEEYTEALWDFLAGQ